MVGRTAGSRLGRRGLSKTDKVLISIAIMGLLYAVAMFIEVTAQTGKSYRDQLLNEKLRKLNAMGKESEPATPAPTASPTPPRISNGQLVTWILSSRIAGKDKDMLSQHSAYARMHDSPPTPLTFTPGSLQLSHVDTLKYCYVDPSIYGRHMQGHRGDGSNVKVSYSDKYKLIYIMLPKSGSSTARYMLKDQFGAVETKKSLQHIDYQPNGKMDGVHVFTFVRDPLSRFFSQYEEAYVRTAPWVSKDNPYYNSQQHPFPYLFENIHSYQEYEDVFCPPLTRTNPNNRKECTDKETAENGTLAARLERFVNEYDGRTPFDVHLTLQVPMLSSDSGIPLYLSQIYNTTDAENGWKSIARQFIGANSTLAQSGSKGVVQGRSYPRRLNNKLVTVESQRRICELALLDYCCLNLPLPEVCRGKYYKDENGKVTELFCKLHSRSGRGSERIQPGIFPQKGS
ncbi:hypothetical protein ACHAXN_009094 [Cyclotella atomus]